MLDFYDPEFILMAISKVWMNEWSKVSNLSLTIIIIIIYAVYTQQQKVFLLSQQNNEIRFF